MIRWFWLGNWEITAPGMEVALEGFLRVSRGNNGRARDGREIALVGVASAMDRKADDREEIQRRKAKDGEQFKTKTTKLDKIDRSVSNLSQSRICEGPEVSADEPLPIHLRRYVMKFFEDPIDFKQGRS